VRIKALILLSSVAVLAACGSEPPPPAQAPTAAPPPPPPPVATAAPNPKPDDNPNKGNIVISDEIKRLCKISDTEAFFAFDSANVRPQDHVVLKKLADCFATGPLKGKRMRLVGHADPRGDEEYNRVLGQRRADNVKNAISAEGLAAAQMETVSRGEDDANGTDDIGWAKDRRVDIVLAT
jgi:peptidoglycan-associated lipoprotein